MHEHVRIVTKAIFLTCVIIASYAAGYGISSLLKLHDNYQSGMWCAVTAIVVFDDLPGNVRKLIWNRLIGTLIGAITAAAGLSLFGHPVITISISLLILIFTIVFFKLDGALKIACVTVLIIGTVAQSLSVAETWIFAGMRFLELVIGGMISLLATLLFDRYRGILPGENRELPKSE